MDLSEGFRCIFNDLLIAKMEVYGLKKKQILVYIYTYLNNRKQYLRSNKVASSLKAKDP